MSPKQAAKLIGITPQQVRWAIRNGKLKARKVDTSTAPFYRYVIRKADAVAYRDLPAGPGRPRKSQGVSNETDA